MNLKIIALSENELKSTYYVISYTYTSPTI